jgi:hypothetical protein
LQERSVATRHLPCPCEKCFYYDFDSCPNIHIVREVGVFSIEVNDVDVPDILLEPLEQYKNMVLLLFMRNYGVKAPKEKDKGAYMLAIRSTLGHLVYDGVPRAT